MSKPIAVAIVSGGLDSVTLAYTLADQDYDLHLLSFDYGQRHKKELTFAAAAAATLSARHDIIDLRSLTHLLHSALTTSTVAVPHGHYEDESMKSTVVPNRNAIMLSIAYGIAASEHAEIVAIGVHAGDHAVYPDCRATFLQVFYAMEHLALDGTAPLPRLYAPYVTLHKQEIVRRGAYLGVPFDQTWSCYEGGNLHCGRCGTCFERRESFILANVPDPTEYTTDLVPTH